MYAMGAVRAWTQRLPALSTDEGGTYGGGTVFKISPDGTETVLYSFTDGTDGGNPQAG
jgi:uncharacterized repeat protein (TIGR03803 family)